MSIHEGYATLSFDYASKASHKDCLFRMNEWKSELRAQQAAQMRGRPGMPGGMPGMPGMPGGPGGMDPGKMLGQVLDEVSKEDPIVGEVIKGVQGVMKDENMQKMAKDLLRGPLKGIYDV